MGTFTELVLAFTFAPQTPSEALAAFAPWKTGDGAPSLPSLDDSFSPEELMEIDEQVEMLVMDSDDAAAVRALPLLRRAVAWQALLNWPDNAYFPGTPSTALRWDEYASKWTLSTRAFPKMGPEAVQTLVAALGEFAAEGSPEQPEFVGYIKGEDPDPPVLIYSHGQAAFQFRDG